MVVEGKNLSVLLDDLVDASDRVQRDAVLANFARDDVSALAHIATDDSESPAKQHAAADALMHALRAAAATYPGAPADDDAMPSTPTSSSPSAPAPSRAPAARISDLLRNVAAADGPDALQAILAGVPAADVDLIGEMLAVDRSPDQQEAAASALGHMKRSRSIAFLRAAATTSTNEPSVRQKCVEALSQFSAIEAVEGLLAVVAADTDLEVQRAAAHGLAERAELISELRVTLKAPPDEATRDGIIAALTEWSQRVHGNGSKVRDALLDATMPLSVREVAASAVGRIERIDSALATLLVVVNAPDQPLRVVAVDEIRKLVTPTGSGGWRTLDDDLRRRTVKALMERLLTDPEPAVRDGALRALEVIDDGDTKLMALFAVADREGLGRGDLDAHRAIAALNESGFGAAHEPLVTHLIRAAVDAQPATIGVIADLLIASKHGDPLAVGTAIDLVRDTGTTETDFSAKLQPLRIEVGGATALDPLLRAAQQDLDTYFRRPLDALNASTETTWRETLGYAQRGFKYRTRMSLIVFGVGVLLLLVAAIAFFTGKKSGNELWGPGIAFGGGLASILLTVYSGPLKDIRQSVTDLAAANAAYIGYVHSVLQVSHTFSRRYLSQDPGQSRLTFKEISESTALIEKATRAAVEALRDIREAAPTQGGSESTGPTSASARGRGGRAARGSAKNSQGKSRS